MADKPSNSRKRVNYQPARDGQAARWHIEERKSAKASVSGKPDATRPPRNQKERAQARAAQRRKEQSSRPLSDGSSATTRKQAQKKAPVVERAKQRERQELRERTRKAEQPERARQQKQPKQERTIVERPERSGQQKRQERAGRVMAENPQRARHASSDRTRGQVMEAMMPQTATKTASHSTIFGLSMRNVLIVILLLVVVVFFLWHPWSSGTDAATTVDDAPPVSDILEERLATVPTYGIVAPVDFNAVEEEGFTAGFVLAHGGVVTDYSLYDTEPELSDESAQALNEALQPFTDNDIITAFLLMDIQTGRGFARNVDKKLYGASSFKGPYCAYLLKQYVDNGDTEVSDMFASGYMTASLGYARSGTDTLKNLIEETIVESSNDAFASLRVAFSDNTLANWLTSVDVDQQVAYDTWFPFNTVRNMAKLWMETYYYLQTNSEAANLLRGFMGETSKSFMREALTGVKALDENELVEPAAAIAIDDADSADGAELLESSASVDGTSSGDTETDAALDELVESSTLRASGSVGQNIGNAIDHSIDLLMAPEIAVLDKAGWNIDSDENYNALVDCGIVTCNGREYLLCVMCDAAYTESNVEEFERLIAAVFEARRDLA